MIQSRGWKRLFRNRMAAASLIILASVAGMAIAAPWVASHSYEEQNISDRLQTPSRAHWLGTDTLGRDLYSRIVYGARVSLAVGFFTGIFALILGTLTGALAGYYGGWLDSALMKIVDLFYIFPSILLAILIMLTLGQGIAGILLALGLTSWVTQARLVRGQVLQMREMPFIESARALGARDGKIIFRHILPNLWGPIIVSLTYLIPTNIMAESFLSFLGLGLQPPYASWGTLAKDGMDAMKSFPHLIIYPGAVLFVTMLAFNFLGDAFRDVLDPKSKDAQLG